MSAVLLHCLAVAELGWAFGSEGCLAGSAVLGTGSVVGSWQSSVCLEVRKTVVAGWMRPWRQGSVVTDACSSSSSAAAAAVAAAAVDSFHLRSSGSRPSGQRPSYNWEETGPEARWSGRQLHMDRSCRVFDMPLSIKTRQCFPFCPSKL